MGPQLRVLQISLCLVAGALLAACGGGGGGSASALPPAAPVGGGNPPSAGSPPSAPEAIAFSVVIPSSTTSSSGARRTRYVSAATKSIVVSFGSQRQSADCTATCDLTLQVVPGVVTFTMSLYDANGGKGNVLSTGQTTTTIEAGKPNRVNLTFGGVVAAIAVALVPGAVTSGTPASVPVIVQAKDAAGYTIVGPDAFANPIQLYNDDTTGATALSATSITAPSANVTLAYSGAASVSAAHITAAIPTSGVRSLPATLAVQPVAVPPPANVPLHTATWYYYGNNNNNMVPMSWLGKHATYIENDGDAAAAFKAAGGKYVMRYTDPAYADYCSPPFTMPAGNCISLIGKHITDESGWLHAADGSRIRHFYDNEVGYQEAMNPKSQQARDAYRVATAGVVAQYPLVDYFFADDSGGTFLGPDGTQMSGHLYGFSAPAVEITSDAQWLAAYPAMFAAAVKPVMINGVDPVTQRPAYKGALVDSPNVMGASYESCLSWNSGVAGYQSNRWVDAENGMLDTTSHHHVIEMCMMTSDPSPSNRLYEMASWWMSYDEQYSVAAPIPNKHFADGSDVMPEYDIVPRQPRATAMNDVAELRSATGAYVREFAACYQFGSPIGPCATVVNPTAASVALPPLVGHYTSALVLNDQSAVSGGTATWSGSVPSQLPSVGAVILR